MQVQLNNGLFPNLPNNSILAVRDCITPIEGPLSDYDYENNQIIRMRYSDFEYQTKFKIKMNSDRFIAMTSEVTSIFPDLKNNVAEFGNTEIYLDVVDDEFRTLITYFDENAIIIERE